jgi:excisionase family DNA binding protein
MTGMPNGLERRRASEALWTAEEVATFIKCSVSYVYKSAERGELPCVRVGRMLRFKPDAVRALVLGADVQGAGR